MTNADAGYLDLPDDPVEASRALYEAGYTDGLPVVPPTPERVAKMLEADARGAQSTLGRVPPRLGSATLEALAVNAVMAGARPESFPVIVAAVDALLDPRFNLLGVQATTHPCAPVVMAHKPPNVSTSEEQLAVLVDSDADLFIVASADCGSCTSWCVHDAIVLERRGKAAVVLATEHFLDLARSEARAYGVPDLRIVSVPHPLADASVADLARFAERALKGLEALV